jgi:NADH:ubiquinone oxidoreductase subunit E
MITVTVCVGSSCHVKGARAMINLFNDFLTKNGLEDRVELKGSFCMERCGEGINWMIGDEILSSPSAAEGAEMFQKKVMAALKKKKKAPKKSPRKKSSRKKSPPKRRS